jgi:hypothetical protein
MCAVMRWCRLREAAAELDPLTYKQPIERRGSWNCLDSASPSVGGLPGSLVYV